MGNNKKFTEDQSYALYLEERKLLVDAEREEARTFDKAILTLASGAFGVSIAFLTNIVPNPFHNTLWLLGWSWTSFAMSLVVILSSFLTSQKACRLQSMFPMMSLWETYDAPTNGRQLPKSSTTCRSASLLLRSSSSDYLFIGIAYTKTKE